MGRPIALIAGLLAIAAAVLSLFIGFLGWWNMDVTIGSNTTVFWYNAFWGNYNGASEEFTYFNEDTVKMLSGGLVCLGGLLCMVQKKTAVIVGAVLIFAGIGLWMANFVDMAKDLVDSLGGDPNDLSNIADLFSGSQTVWFITISWRVGYGLYAALASGILALVGSAGRDD